MNDAVFASRWAHAEKKNIVSETPTNTFSINDFTKKRPQMKKKWTRDLAEVDVTFEDVKSDQKKKVSLVCKSR